ncbi:Alpha/Beta hydrolase protein [Phycomyces nitens]|nr:Alpha/Beta hydrolase protein [Phycomyces nitens]
MNGDGVAEPSRSKPRPYLSYMLNTYKNLFLTFYFNWTMIFTAPISSLAFVIVYPTAVVLLFIFEIGLKVFMDYLGGAAFVHYIGGKYGEGAPDLLLSQETAELVRATLPSLGKPEPPNKAGGGGVRSRTFDLSIAQTFTVLSSVIYERDADKVKSAYEAYATATKTGVVDLEDHIESPVEKKMRCLLWQSERRIRTIVSNWGLHFAGVSELKSLGGPFCGIFWSEEHPFIVVAFKGTTPTNYEEFLVDATFQRTDARSYLFGSVHEGFYESVFPTAGFGSDDTRDPYGAILSAVQEKAQQMQSRLGTSEPIQVWITGHSLGAAMSSLLFARWLKCPEDLTSHCVLRDAYVIGTPAVGDNDFASYFSSFSNHPVSRTSTLWRIINKHDIICRIPPGYDSQTIGNYMSSTDFFNYSHIGHAIQINSSWHRKPLRVYPSGYQATMQVEIVMGGYEERSPWFRTLANRFTDGNPIHAIESIYPFFFRDHIPVHYFQGLNKARGFCFDMEEKNRQAKL